MRAERAGESKEKAGIGVKAGAEIVRETIVEAEAEAVAGVEVMGGGENIKAAAAVRVFKIEKGLIEELLEKGATAMFNRSRREDSGQRR